MRLLLDTHIVLWGAVEPERLSKSASSLIEDPENEIAFSAVSLWEVAIKTGRGRADFRIDPGLLRRNLFDNGYSELAVTGAHAAALVSLPPLHKDPFDRMLVAQATVEGVTLLTADPAVAKYPGPIRLVRPDPRMARRSGQGHSAARPCNGVLTCGNARATST